jgi:hypothetical protein
MSGEESMLVRMLPQVASGFTDIGRSFYLTMITTPYEFAFVFKISSIFSVFFALECPMLKNW